MKKTLPIFVLFILITSIIAANSLASLPAERQTLVLPSLTTFKKLKKRLLAQLKMTGLYMKLKLKKMILYLSLCITQT